jgi:hypothetical protein
MDQAVRKNNEHEGIAIDKKHKVEISMAQNLHLYSRTSSSKHGGRGLHPRPSVFFLIEKIDPSDSIFLKRSFDPPSQISHSKSEP